MTNINRQTSSLVELIAAVVLQVFNIKLENPEIEGTTLTCTVNNNQCEINIDYINNEATGECLDIILYSDDVPQVDGFSIDKSDRDHDDIYDEVDEINGVNEDFTDFMNNEDDDSEDRGESM